MRITTTSVIALSLIFAGTAVAAVTLSLEQGSVENWVSMNYDSTGGPLPRAFALESGWVPR